MRAPSACRSSLPSVLTVARVPTGMKTGVSTTPCPVCSKPARARVSGHSATISKTTWATNHFLASGLPASLGAHGYPRVAHQVVHNSDERIELVVGGLLRLQNPALHRSQM